MPSAKEIRALCKSRKIRGHATYPIARCIELLEEQDRLLASKEEDVKDVVEEVVEDVVPAKKTRAKKAKTEVAAPASEPAFEAEAVEPVAPKVKPARKTTANAWSCFLADYQKEHKCGLKEAMREKEKYHLEYKPNWKKPEAVSA